MTAWPPAPAGETRPAASWSPVEGETDLATPWQPAENETNPVTSWPPAQEGETRPALTLPPAGGRGRRHAPARTSAEEGVRPPGSATDDDLPALPAFPGAQPWEVREGEAGPYDWFAGPEGEDDQQPPSTGTDTTAPAHPGREAAWGQEAAPTEPWPTAPVVPGAPRWEPPPAFTAAAAGMQVWPAPVADTPAMPPWPAATGELEPEGDESATAGSTPKHGAPAATRDSAPPSPRPGQPDEPRAERTDPHGTHPGQTDPHEPPPGTETAPLRGLAPLAPARHDPAPPRRDTIPGKAAPSTPAPLFDPNATAPHRAVSAHPSDSRKAPPFPTASGGRPGQPGTPPLGGRPGHPGSPPLGAPIPADTGSPPDTDSPASPYAARKALPSGSGGWPTSTPGPKLPPAPLFAPKQPSAPGADTGPMPLEGPPAERGDIPVWPPQGPEQQDKVPDLPFSPEVWDRKSPDPSAQHLPAPLTPDALRQPPPLQQPIQQPGKSRRALFATLGVLVLAGVATGGFFAVRSVNSPAPEAAPTAPPAPPATPTAAPSVSTPAEAAGTAVLNSEVTDPKKLSLAEAFPKKRLSAAGAEFTRVKSDVAATCEDAAAGPFAEALREQKCSRVVRATYVDAKRRYAVTTGIAVLPSKDAALRADQAKNLDRNLWFRGLPGAAGSGGDRVHIAGGYAAGLVWGRYIVFSYATHADGHTPEAKEKTLIKVSSAFRDQTSLVLERRITQD